MKPAPSAENDQVAIDQLRAVLGEVEKNVCAARFDVAKLIALTAAQAGHPLSQPDVTADARALQQQVKAALARAGSHLALASPRLASPDSDQMIAGEVACPTEELVRLRKENRDLFAELSRLSILVSRARQSRWLKLGQRLGADLAVQLDMISTLIEEVESRHKPHFSQGE